MASDGLTHVVRGMCIDAGSCVFVPDGTAHVRFGNIVGVEEERCLVSFGNERRSRREEPQWFQQCDVLCPDEVETRLEEIPQSGARYAKFLSSNTIELLEHIETVSGEGESTKTVLVRPLELSVGGGTTATEATRCEEPGNLFQVLLVAKIARWRFIQPVDVIVDVLQDPVGLEQSTTGPAILRLTNIDVPVNAVATFEGPRVAFQTTAHYQIASVIGTAAPFVLQDERLEPLSSALSWSAGVVVAGANHGTEGYQGSIEVLHRGVTVDLQGGEASYERYIYAGAPWRIWTHPLLFREPALNLVALQFGQWPLLASLQFLWKNHRTILFEPWFEKEHPGNADHIAAIRVGPPLTVEERAVLAAFIGYITGGRARNVLIETYDRSQRKVHIEYRDVGSPTKRRSPPLPDRPSPYFGKIASQLPILLDAFEAWRKRDARSFDAFFHHYAEGVDSSYPVTRVLRLAVAFDAFVNLVTQDFCENEAIIESDFPRVRNALYATLDELKEQPGILTEMQWRRLRTKVENLNSASNTRRMRAFWNAVDIEHSEDDDDLLRRLRNESVHRGYLGAHTNEEQVRQDLLDANRLTDLVNRAVLAYAGYDGPARSASDGSWLNLRTGERFRVPPLPAREHRSIEITVTPPPMADAEQEAYRKLQANQRPPEDPHYIVDSTLSWDQWAKNHS